MKSAQFLFGLILLLFQNVFGQERVIHNFKIQGNNRVKASFIKRISTVKIGAALDSAMLDKDIVRLKRLPSIAHAYYQVFPDKAKGYHVLYNIEENFTLIPSLNVYTTNDDEFAYRLGLYEFNTLDRGIIFGGFYQKDIYSSYAINFRAPYLFSNKWGLAINRQDLTTLEPVFFDNTSSSYRYNNDSFEVLGLYEMNFYNRFELGLNYFKEAYEYQFGATSPNVPQDLNVKKWLLRFVYDYNKLDYFYQYVSGFRSWFTFQYVTSTNDTLPDFFVGWNDFFWFQRVGKHGNWANRLRFGLATNDKTPFAPFSVDNNVNIRGVGNVIDRGTGSVVLNTEYRATLVEKGWFVLQGNAFIDAGSWRNPGGPLSDFLISDNIKVYPGLGFRFIHKKIYNAIFRIDYGYGVTKNASQGFVFGIGQYF
ncbi:outer membrane protein assembly factor [Tamlana fucoidanivorans]|uniref:Outer membrane protein assembly factor n=1 Tax=Allotamlana fucoidanivorans TaxID=2583814 RepID=A0A5C4SJ38_9FLAO|nr:outer membrane protein assembly factor [Tamlana fucoidanivorans]TNJ43840.1 outer membrane protein assembly factor [Tamlana fucoidanivorans]